MKKGVTVFPALFTTELTCVPCSNQVRVLYFFDKNESEESITGRGLALSFLCWNFTHTTICWCHLWLHASSCPCEWLPPYSRYGSLTTCPTIYLLDDCSIWELWIGFCCRVFEGRDRTRNVGLRFNHWFSVYFVTIGMDMQGWQCFLDPYPTHGYWKWVGFYYVLEYMINLWGTLESVNYADKENIRLLLCTATSKKGVAQLEFSTLILQRFLHK